MSAYSQPGLKNIGAIDPTSPGGQPVPPRIADVPARSRRLIRCAEAILFIAQWMAFGWCAHLRPDDYLLAGVPLLIGFQVLVRKQPLVKLWVRDADRFRLNRFGVMIAVAFAVMPVIDAIRDGGHSWSRSLWYGACIFGALGVGFSVSRFNRTTVKALYFCLATAGTIGIALMILGALIKKHSLVPTPGRIIFCAHQFLLYFPVSFVLEEVVFRGALDSHVHQPGESRPYWSAFLVSALWGLWHLPILPFGDHKGALAYLIMGIGSVILIAPQGIFFSLGWRRSGNLAVPAFVHALVDAVRNTLLR